MSDSTHLAQHGAVCSPHVVVQQLIRAAPLAQRRRQYAKVGPVGRHGAGIGRGGLAAFMLCPATT